MSEAGTSDGNDAEREADEQKPVHALATLCQQSLTTLPQHKALAQIISSCSAKDRFSLIGTCSRLLATDAHLTARQTKTFTFSVADAGRKASHRLLRMGKRKQSKIEVLCFACVANRLDADVQDLLRLIHAYLVPGEPKVFEEDTDSTAGSDATPWRPRARRRSWSSD